METSQIEAVRAYLLFSSGNFFCLFLGEDASVCYARAERKMWRSGAHTEHSYTNPPVHNTPPFFTRPPTTYKQTPIPVGLYVSA